MLSDDEIGHILSFLGWRDLIFITFNIDTQFRTGTVSTLQRIRNLLVISDADDAFCLQYLKHHHIHLDHLSNLTVTWNGSHYAADSSKTVNHFVLNYRPQLRSLTLSQCADTLSMFSKISKRESPATFPELKSLNIREYIMDGFSFDFFSLFENIRELRINGHILRDDELREIQNSCPLLNAIELTPVSCALWSELIDNLKDRLEIVSLHLGYLDISPEAHIWKSLSQCTTLKVLLIEDILMMESDIDTIFKRESPLSQTIEVVEVQSYTWKMGDEYEMKCRFPALRAFQRIDPMMHSIQSMNIRKEESFGYHFFVVEWKNNQWNLSWGTGARAKADRGWNQILTSTHF